jgi:hypothetical protein
VYDKISLTGEDRPRQETIARLLSANDTQSAANILGAIASDPPNRGNNMDGDEAKKLNRRFLAAKEGRRYEIDKFWQRSTFFWVFIAASVVAFGKATEGAGQFLFACFGLVSSVAWTLQNRGSKYWQEAWELKTEQTELAALGSHLFRHEAHKWDRHFSGASKYSVSKLTIALSDFSVLVWAGLALYSSHFKQEFLRSHRNCIYPIILGLTVVYCLLVAFFARRNKDNHVKEIKEGL